MAISLLLALLASLVYLLVKRKGTPIIVQDPATPASPDTLSAVLDTVPAPHVPEIPPHEPTSSAMASFDQAYRLVARAEGGYQNLRSDEANQNSRGEWVGTNWGIIPDTYERATGRVPTEADMRNLTKLEARAMFRKLFWDPIQGDQIPDQQVAEIFFDGHVNHGTWGIQLMQRTLGVVADGLFGPRSLAALKRKNPQSLFNAYKETRRLAYEDLLRRRPWMENPWRRVWMNRINTFNYGGGSVAVATFLTLATVTYLLTR